MQAAFVRRVASSVLLLCAVCLASTPAHTQERVQHRHVLPNGIEGSLDKGYRIVRGDSVLTGDWRFRASLPDTADNELVRSWEIQGRYDQGAPVGEWSYSAKALRSSDRPVVQGFQLVLNTSGEERLINANFRNGKAQGIWRVLDHRISEGASTDTVLRVQAAFAEGGPSGAFSARSSDGAIAGAFLPGGLIHGEWRYLHGAAGASPIVEVRRYEEGLLREHRLEQGDLRFVIAHAGLSMSAADSELELKELELDQAYFDLLALTAFLPDGADHATFGRVTASSNGLLLSGLHGLAHHATQPIWELLPNGHSPKGGRARLSQYPYSVDEQRARAQLLLDHAAASELIEGFLQDPLADLGRHAYPEIALAMEVLTAYRAHLADIQLVIDVLEHPLNVHVQRKAFLSARVRDWAPAEEVAYSFKDSLMNGTHVFQALVTNGDMDVPRLQEHLALVVKDLRGLRRRTDSILDKYRSQGLLVEKEERLVRKRDSLLALYANEAGRDDHNVHHERLAAPMRDMVLTTFKEYAGLAQDGKLERIDGLLACYNEGIEVYHKQVRTPLRIDRITEVYTRSIWNPHTFTYMDERIKERLYRAYENTLLPLVLEQQEGHVRCGRLMPKQQNMVKLYQRMMELREQDTRALERQLRRGMDADEVLRILELQLDLDP